MSKFSYDYFFFFEKEGSLDFSCHKLLSQMSYPIPATNPSNNSRVMGSPQAQVPVKSSIPSMNDNFQQNLVTPPNATGISPLVVFEIKLPASQKKEQEDLDDSTDHVESSEENLEESNGEAENNKQNKTPKFNTYIVDGLEQRQARINDLVSYLLNNCDDKDFEIQGGFRLFKTTTTKDGNIKKNSLSQFDLETIPQALGWVKSIVDLLRNSQSVTVPIDNQDELLFVRSNNQVRVTRKKSSKKEVWFQLEDLCLAIREQGKKYLKVAQAVEDTLERKESRAGDKSKKDLMKKRRIAVSEKLQTRTFRSLLKTMKDLFLSSDLPALKEKYQRQEQLKDQQRKRLLEQNRDMMAMVLEAAPEGFLEMDISHIDEQETVVEEPQQQQQQQSSQQSVTDNSQDTPPTQVKEKRKKKSKAEIRRLQEESFDNAELANELISQPEVVIVKKPTVTPKPTEAYQNAFDLGEISQESIFKLTQSSPPVKEEKKAKNKTQKRTQQRKEKSTTETKPATTTTTTKKKKNKSKNNKPQRTNMAQKQTQLPEESSVNVPVLLVVGVATLAFIYYAYTLLQ